MAKANKMHSNVTQDGFVKILAANKESPDDLVEVSVDVGSEIAAIEQSIADNADTPEQLAIETVPEKRLIEIGYKLAKEMEAADHKAGQTKRQLLIQVAEKYGARPDQAKVILEGLAKYHKDEGAEDSVIKVRKAEAKAVFDAANKRQITGVNQMKEFNGGYHAFIEFCRDLRGRQEHTSTEGTQRAPKMTDKQQSAILEKIADGNDAQLVAIASESVKSILAGVPAEKASLAGKSTLLVIQRQAETLLNSAKVDAFFHTVAQSILDVVNPALEQLNKAEQDASAVQQMAQGEKLAA